MTCEVVAARGNIYGADVTPGFAEAWAIKMAFRIMIGLGIAGDVTIVSDNLKSVEAYARRRGSYTKSHDELWCQIFHLAGSLNATVQWVPAPGKKEDWRPPEPRGAEGRRWRKLNDAADRKCTEVIKEKSRAEPGPVRERRHAEQWTTQALAAAARATQAWHEENLPEA